MNADISSVRISPSAPDILSQGEGVCPPHRDSAVRLGFAGECFSLH